MGLCESQQAALAKAQAQEQLTSNDIPQVDLSQPMAPFILNVPGLLYPQESPKQEAPKQEAPKQVHRSLWFCTHEQQCVLCLLLINNFSLHVALYLIFPVGK